MPTFVNSLPLNPMHLKYCKTCQWLDSKTTFGPQRQKCKIFYENNNKKLFDVSGCGTVGKAVASDTRGPGFEFSINWDRMQPSANSLLLIKEEKRWGLAH